MNKVQFTIDLKVTGAYGLNSIYAGSHWSKRNKKAQDIHVIVKDALRKCRIKKNLFTVPVKITFEYNSRLDISNHGYLNKMIEDSLKDYLIVDDTQRYVKEHTTRAWGGKGIRVTVEPWRREGGLS